MRLIAVRYQQKLFKKYCFFLLTNKNCLHIKMSHKNVVVEYIELNGLKKTSNQVILQKKIY